jgi:hypothetical protein
VARRRCRARPPGAAQRDAGGGHRRARGRGREEVLSAGTRRSVTQVAAADAARRRSRVRTAGVGWPSARPGGGAGRGRRGLATGPTARKGECGDSCINFLGPFFISSAS